MVKPPKTAIALLAVLVAMSAAPSSAHGVVDSELGMNKPFPQARPAPPSIPPNTTFGASDSVAPDTTSPTTGEPTANVTSSPAPTTAHDATHTDAPPQDQPTPTSTAPPSTPPSPSPANSSPSPSASATASPPPPPPTSTSPPSSTTAPGSSSSPPTSSPATTSAPTTVPSTTTPGPSSAAPQTTAPVTTSAPTTAPSTKTPGPSSAAPQTTAKPSGTPAASPTTPPNATTNATTTPQTVAPTSAPPTTGAGAGGNSSAGSGQRTNPLVIKGPRIFDSVTGEYFGVRGVDYYPRPNGGPLNVNNHDFFTAEFKHVWGRDVPQFSALNANTIRLYAVDPDGDHTEFMCALQAAGIYVVVDLASSCPGCEVTAEAAPACYPASYKERGQKIISNFAKYDNVLGFSGGNEINHRTQGNPPKWNAPCQKKFIRDMRAFIKSCPEMRQIPVGLVIADTYRDWNAMYYNCRTDPTDELETAEWFGINVYVHCDDISDPKSAAGFNMLRDSFRSFNYSIPTLLTEFGCLSPAFPTVDGYEGQRTFHDAKWMNDREYSDVFNGGMVFEYSTELANSQSTSAFPFKKVGPQNYGLGYLSPENCDEVNIPCDFIRFPNFDNLAKAYGATDTSDEPTLESFVVPAHRSLPSACPVNATKLSEFTWVSDGKSNLACPPKRVFQCPNVGAPARAATPKGASTSKPPAPTSLSPVSTAPTSPNNSSATPSPTASNAPSFNATKTPSATTSTPNSGMTTFAPTVKTASPKPTTTTPTTTPASTTTTPKATASRPPTNTTSTPIPISSTAGPSPRAPSPKPATSVPASTLAETSASQESTIAITSDNTTAPTTSNGVNATDSIPKAQSFPPMVPGNASTPMPQSLKPSLTAAPSTSAPGSKSPSPTTSSPSQSPSSTPPAVTKSPSTSAPGSSSSPPTSTPATTSAPTTAPSTKTPGPSSAAPQTTAKPSGTPAASPTTPPNATTNATTTPQTVAPTSAPPTTGAGAGGNSSAGSGQRTNPLVIKGPRIFDSVTGEYFGVRGVDYYPRPNGGPLNVNNHDFFTAEFKHVWGRDVPQFSALNANTIRLYAVDPDGDHTEFMCALQAAGIYVVVDLASSCPGCEVTAEAAPACYPASYKERGQKIISNFAKYDNVLGFSGGNEINHRTQGNPPKWNAPCQKKFIRDMRAFIKSCPEMRQIPVGLVIADTYRDWNAMYYNCRTDPTDELETAEWFGINVYVHCDDISDPKSAAGFNMLRDSFRSFNYSIPTLLTEFGCLSPAFPTVDGYEGQRTFHDAKWMNDREYSDVFNGGMVFEYSTELANSQSTSAFPFKKVGPQNYGLGYLSPENCDEVNIPCDFIRFPNFDNLAKAYGATDTSDEPTLESFVVPAHRSLPSACPVNATKLSEFTWVSDGKSNLACPPKRVFQCPNVGAPARAATPKGASTSKPPAPTSLSPVSTAPTSPNNSSATPSPTASNAPSFNATKTPSATTSTPNSGMTTFAPTVKTASPKPTTTTPTTTPASTTTTPKATASRPPTNTTSTPIPTSSTAGPSSRSPSPKPTTSVPTPTPEPSTSDEESSSMSAAGEPDQPENLDAGDGDNLEGDAGVLDESTPAPEHPSLTRKPSSTPAPRKSGTPSPSKRPQSLKPRLSSASVSSVSIMMTVALMATSLFFTIA